MKRDRTHGNKTITNMQYFGERANKLYAAKLERERAIYLDAGIRLQNGALWGDLACFEPEEWEECRLIQLKTQAARAACKRAEAIAAVAAAAVAVQAPDEREPEQELPFAFVKCLNCDFGVHTNPPAHFTELDIGFCCSLCRINGRHGGQCQKRSN